MTRGAGNWELGIRNYELRSDGGPLGALASRRRLAKTLFLAERTEQLRVPGSPDQVESSTGSLPVGVVQDGILAAGARHVSLQSAVSGETN